MKGISVLRPRLLVLVGMVLAAAFSRLIPHPPNMASMAAVALFGGAYFADKRMAFLVPFAALLLSDLILGVYRHMEVVYASFAAVVCIGFWLQRKRSTLRVGLAAVASSAVFFVLTNLGVWAFGSIYPNTLAGLVACYVAAIPFLGNSLQGDLLYTVVLFGGFRMAEETRLASREWSASAV